MIPPLLIVISAVFSAAAVAGACRYARWPSTDLAVATAGTLAAVIIWRLVANALWLNGDFMPAISVGDAGCLVAGSMPAAIVASVHRQLARRVLPAVAGGLVAFIVNVVIL